MICHIFRADRKLSLQARWIALKNDLSLSCAFHKNEVTTNRRWSLRASRMCNLCGKLRLPLILHNAKRSCGCVSIESPGAFWHQDSYLSVQLSFSTATVARRNCWFSPPGTKLAEITAFQLRTQSDVFSKGMLLVLILQCRRASFHSNNGWKISDCSTHKKRPENRRI